VTKREWEQFKRIVLLEAWHVYYNYELRRTGDYVKAVHEADRHYA
jgi:hypothetical protein